MVISSKALALGTSEHRGRARKDRKNWDCFSKALSQHQQVRSRLRFQEGRRARVPALDISDSELGGSRRNYRRRTPTRTLHHTWGAR
jgi:hypothetical protein